MDLLVKQVAQRGMNHPLPLHPGLAGKMRAFDRQAEVALAGGIVAAVAAVLVAVVNQLNFRRVQRLGQPPPHFRCNRAGGERVHAAYI